MLKQAKKAFLQTAQAAGLFSLFRNSDWRSKRLLILGYHGVSLEDEHIWHPDLYLSRDTFRERMQSLRDGGFNVLQLGHALKLLQEGTLPPRAVVITVDDGLYDFYECAWPILKEFGFPATVYQTTYYSAHRFPVFDLIISYLLWKGHEKKIDGIEFTGQREMLDLSTFDARQSVVGKIRAFVVSKKLTAKEKDAMARRLAQSLQVDYEKILRSRIGQLMTPEQVSEIVAAGVDVQLHTHRHRTPSDAALFKREIEDNRRELEAAGARNAVHFCYPSGIYKPEFLPWLKDCGVLSATLCEHGFAMSETDSLLLPRLMDTSRLSKVEFESWLSGLGGVLPARTQQREAALY